MKLFNPKLVGVQGIIVIGIMSLIAQAAFSQLYAKIGSNNGN